MLTRRSRKEAVASPDESSNSSPKTKKPSTPTRRKSKSADRKIRTRSRSSKRLIPQIVLTRLSNPINVEMSKSEKKKKKKPVDSEIRKTVTPVKENNIRNSPFVDKSNYEVSVTAVSSRLTHVDDDDDDDINGSEYELINNSKADKLENEFKRSFGNLILAILSPILVILAIIGLKAKGNLIPFPRGYLRVANYYDLDVFTWTFVSMVFQFLISLLPLTAKFDKFDNDDCSNGSYRFSGIMNLIIASLTVAAMDYYKFPLHFILEIITKKTVPFVVASVLYALIISIVLFIKATYTNQKVKYFIPNSILRFFIGTTSYSTLGPINVKLALYRYSWLLTILFNSLVILNSIKNAVNIHLYFIAGLQILFAIDKFIFEFHLSKSYYLNNEKDGYWTIIQQFIQPAVNFLPIQVLLSKNVPTNYVILSISSIIFILGFICQRYSDFKEYKLYRSSSYSRKFKSKTIPDGFGSLIKYPSYLGTIIVHFALILPIFELNLVSLQSSWPVFLYPLYYIITLAYYCTRISTYRELEAGHSMYYYNAAKWNLIPKIF